jgi:TatD DNase family protein
MLADTHAHLDARAFKDDRDEVISRAWAAGLGAIVTVGSDVDSSALAIRLAHDHARVKVVAIGEVGLDFHYSLSSPVLQRQMFSAQLELASRLGRPVVVHDREAHEDTLCILRDWAGKHEHRGLRGVLHCFSGDAAIADMVMALGFCVSFGGPVTFTNARRLQGLVRELPLDHILLETDCPYLAPHPHRGKRNEPANVRLVAGMIAELKGMTIDVVAATTTANAARLFGFVVS